MGSSHRQQVTEHNLNLNPKALFHSDALHHHKARHGHVHLQQDEASVGLGTGLSH